MTAEEQAKYGYYTTMAAYMQDEAFALGFSATAYVEDLLDVMFWRALFGDKKIHFQYETRTLSGNDTTGSGQCLLYKEYGLLNKAFFICIDSDYRFVLQDASTNIHSFVFQTYTYSIENHFCYAKRIQQICKDLSLNEFEFEHFLSNYSAVIFPLLVYSVYREKHKIGADDFTLTYFSDKISRFSIEDANFNENAILKQIEEKVKSEIVRLQNTGLYPQDALTKTQKELKDIGINETNAYLYIRGHDLQDNLIIPILQKLKHQTVKQLPNKDRATLSKKNVHALVENLTKTPLNNYIELTKVKTDIATFFS